MCTGQKYSHLQHLQDRKVLGTSNCLSFLQESPYTTNAISSECPARGKFIRIVRKKSTQLHIDLNAQCQDLQSSGSIAICRCGLHANSEL